MFVYTLIYLLLFFFIIIIILLLIREFFCRFKYEYKVQKLFPGKKPILLIGNCYDFLFQSPEKLFRYPRIMASKFKSPYKHYILGLFALNVSRCKDVEIFLSNSKLINKSFLYNFLHSFMGTGLLASSGKKWIHRRRILTPAFHFNILQRFYNSFSEEGDNLVEVLKQETENKDGSILQDITSIYTLNTICETAMGVRLSSMEEPGLYRYNIHKIGEFLTNRIARPWLYNDHVYKLLGYQNRLNKYLEPVHNFTRNVINKRRDLFNEKTLNVNNPDENIYEKKNRYAMLDTLLAAQAMGEDIDDDGIREEVDTFMFEGHDTTSVGLTYTLMMLANYPEVQEKIYNEIKQTIDNLESEQDLKPFHYNAFKYMDCVLKECLRLYPPVSFISRELTEEIVIDNILVPIGTTVHFHIFDIHRDPTQFPDPEKFDPDRFLPENVEKRHPFSYIPFSAGPRNCIGQKFAMLEMKSILTKLLWNFKITPITKPENVVFVADLVLRSKYPILAKFSIR